MGHHRCTRCKQEPYPRHKYYGGVFCDKCISWIRGRNVGHQVSIFSRFWHLITDFVQKVVGIKKTPKQVERQRERQIYTQMKVMESRARKIGVDKRTLVPQKM